MKSSKPKTLQSILNTNRRYLNRWLCILCNTDEYYNLFLNEFLDISDLEYSMFEFQNHLKFVGRGQNITIEDIQDCINRKDAPQLKALLEEMLLIPVDSIEIAKVLKIKEQDNLADFIDKIKLYSNSRYAKVIQEYFNYFDKVI